MELKGIFVNKVKKKKKRRVVLGQLWLWSNSF